MGASLEILRYIGNFLFPPTCHLCGASLSSEDSYLCPLCLARLPRTLYHRTAMNPMEQRFAGLFPFERATAHFFYTSQSDLSILMQDLKYRHYRGLARKLGETVGAELLTTSFLTDIDYIVPIPIHFIKKAIRGYNQTEEIAKGISKATRIPINTDLTAIRPHRTQTKLTLDQRRHNTQNIFRLNPHSSLLKNLTNNKDIHILLLDDVCTTGSTITSAAEAIISAAPTLRLSILTLGCTF